jgi:glycosyltransferase involved in cell wall biosynthesis
MIKNTGHPSAVSVVMSVCNAEAYVADAVASILRQTFRDFEFIIVNDGSTDRTAEILAGFRDPRITVISQNNQGLTASLNRALRIARGTYIARMDADDISLPERLERQVQFLEENPAVGLMSCHFCIIDADGKHRSLCRPPAHNAELQQELLIGNQFCHGAAVFRVECIKTVGAYREFFKFAQDYDLWLRIAEKYQCANLAVPLYQWRDERHSLSLGSLKEKNNQFMYAAFAILLAKERRTASADRLQRYPERQWDLAQELNGTAGSAVLSSLYFTASRGLQRRGDIPSARVLAQKACLSSPLRWRYWQHLFALMRHR